MQDVLDRMCRRIVRHANGVQLDTALPGVGIGSLWKRRATEIWLAGPGVCLVVQGAKQMFVGDKVLRYSAGSCFVSVVDLPTTRCVFETSTGKPYVATSLMFDQPALIALMAETRSPPPNDTVAAFNVAKVSRELLEAWDHHLALLDTPDDIPVLAASREREILYRLLQSPHGPMLRQIVQHDGNLARVRRAIDWMRKHVDQPVPVPKLAELAGMSVASFNRHFRTATSTSPLQYHKALRLQTARRLLATNKDAADTAYAVGYESASQFSREYARMFGRPPKQDAARLRENLTGVASVLI